MNLYQVFELLESPVFNKSSILFGLNLAKAETIDNLIVVEGYLDVISLYEFGLRMRWHPRYRIDYGSS